MYRILLLWLGKFIQAVSRLRGSGGSALPGLIIEKLSGSFLYKTARHLKHGTVMITGTNGKTTTTKLAADILEQSGHRVIVNRTGSNMSRGIISTLVEHSSWYGQLRGDIGIFEVDEAYVPDVAAKLKPRVLAVLNLLRDQLDRYGELDRAAQLIKQGVAQAGTVVLNADDGLVAKLAGGINKDKVRYFGAAESLRRHLPDDKGLLSRAKQLIQHHSHSSVVLNSAKPLDGRQQLSFRYLGQDYQTVLPLSGIYNAYNAAAALAVCVALKEDFAKSSRHLSAASPAFGRTERIELGNKAVELLLVKNPAGFNQIIQTFLIGHKQLPILMALNDNFADGRDVSWIWDVDFEPLAAQAHVITTTGTRAADLALRLKYAEVKAATNDRPERALRDFTAALKPGETGYIVPTYTAMLKLRRLLSKQADLKEIWQ